MLVECLVLRLVLMSAETKDCAMDLRMVDKTDKKLVALSELMMEMNLAEHWASLTVESSGSERAGMKVANLVELMGDSKE